MILLDAGVLVLDVQRRGDALGEDPGAKAARGGMASAVEDSAVEDQRHPVGAPHVEVLGDDGLEERPARGGTVQHLGQGELGLEDRDVVAVTGPAVRGAEGMRQAGQPLAQQPVDASRVQPVTGALQTLRVLTGGEAVVERLETDPGLGYLPLGPLVAVQAQLRRVGEVRAEFDEERPEVGVDGIDVEVVDHRRGPHDPRVGGTGDRVAALLSAEHRGFLLSPAQEQHALVTLEAGQELVGQIIFALPLGKIDDRHTLIGGEAVQLGDELPADRLQQRRRGERLAPVLTQEEDHSPDELQLGHEDVEVHPVDALHLESHVFGKDLGGAAG